MAELKVKVDCELAVAISPLSVLVARCASNPAPFVTMSRRRLAYTLPPPSYPIPQLFLPPSEAQRHGRPHPLIWPIRPPILQYPEHVDTHAPSATGGSGNGTSSIRHRLGVASLALDASFCGFPQNESDFDGLSSDSEGGVEGGVLYSGGRDGMVVSWTFIHLINHSEGIRIITPIAIVTGRGQARPCRADDGSSSLDGTTRLLVLTTTMISNFIILLEARVEMGTFWVMSSLVVRRERDIRIARWGVGIRGLLMACRRYVP